MSKKVFFIVSLILLAYLGYIQKYGPNTGFNGGSGGTTRTVIRNGTAAVKVKTQTSNAYMKNDGNSKVGVLFAIESNSNNDIRDPYELAIVLDRSGSMSGAKIENAKQAIINIIDQMIDGDIIHVIQYDDTCNVVWEDGVYADKKKIMRAVNGIYARGSTNLWKGLRKAYEVIEWGIDSDITKYTRIFLFSDGLINKGVSDQNVMTKYIKRWRETREISISTFGIGYGFDKDLMDNIANVGRGNAFFIGEASDIDKVTGVARKDAESIVGTDGKLILKTVNHSNIDISMNLFGRDMYRDNNQYNVIDIRDVRTGDTKFATIELNVNIDGLIKNEYIELIEWELQYNNVTSKTRDVLRGKVGIKLVNNDESGIKLIENNENTEVTVNVDLNKLRVMEEDALNDIKEGSFDSGIKKRQKFEAKSKSFFNGGSWNDFKNSEYKSRDMASNVERRMNDEKAVTFYGNPDKIKNDREYRKKMLKYHPDKMALNAEQSTGHNEL